MFRFTLSAVAAVLFVALVGAASAQTIVVNPGRQPMAPGSVEPVRISLAVSIFVPAPNGDSEQALKAQESGRRMIYEVAARECALLLDVLASDCHLESINVTVQRLAAGQFGQAKVEGFNISGNVGFRITPK